MNQIMKKKLLSFILILIFAMTGCSKETDAGEEVLDSIADGWEETCDSIAAIDQADVVSDIVSQADDNEDMERTDGDDMRSAGAVKDSAVKDSTVKDNAVKDSAVKKAARGAGADGDSAEHAEIENGNRDVPVRSESAEISAEGSLKEEAAKKETAKEETVIEEMSKGETAKKETPASKETEVPKETESLSKHTHTPGAKVYWPMEPSCQGAANFTVSCTDCGEQLESGTTPALEHTPVTVELCHGDCVNETVTETSCSVCGTHLGRDAHTEPDAHDWITGSYEEWDAETHSVVEKATVYCARCGKQQ